MSLYLGGTMDHSNTVVKATAEVVGRKVMNNADDDLGKVKELMLDKVGGQVKYIVLESGSLLGLGGKLFAIPWNSINYDKTKECFRLNLDKDKLKNAPGFDKDHWPDMADRTWAQNVETYYKGN